MDRRLGGALLVVAVVVAAIVIPARGGLRIVGSPVVGAPPAAPQVGACVYQRPADPPENTGMLALPASTPLPASHGRSPATANALTIGVCDGQPAVGEVVAIGRARPDGLGLRPPAQDCRPLALRYAGLVRTEAGYVLPGQRTTDPVSWTFSINLRSGWMMPSAPLRAVGQTWAACVVASPVTDQYLGRVATAYGGGRLPDEFGTCWNSRDVSAGVTPVDCGSPHLSELIAVGTVRDRATATTASVISSCRNLAASVIGRSDPTASGSLAVHISPRSIESSQPAANPLTTVCYVVPTGHSLTGTLVGLGDRPIPFAR